MGVDMRQGCRALRARLAAGAGRDTTRNTQERGMHIGGGEARDLGPQCGLDWVGGNDESFG